MSPTSRPLERTRVASDGQLMVPVEVVRAADLQPGDEVVFGPALGGFFVQSREAAEAEDAADREALDLARADAGESLAWSEVKRELKL